MSAGHYAVEVIRDTVRVEDLKRQQEAEQHLTEVMTTLPTDVLIERANDAGFIPAIDSWFVNRPGHVSDPEDVVQTVIQRTILARVVEASRSNDVSLAAQLGLYRPNRPEQADALLRGVFRAASAAETEVSRQRLAESFSAVGRNVAPNIAPQLEVLAEHLRHAKDRETVRLLAQPLGYSVIEHQGLAGKLRGQAPRLSPKETVSAVALAAALVTMTPSIARANETPEPVIVATSGVAETPAVVAPQVPTPVSAPETPAPAAEAVLATTESGDTGLVVNAEPQTFTPDTADDRQALPAVVMPAPPSKVKTTVPADAVIVTAPKAETPAPAPAKVVTPDTIDLPKSPDTTPADQQPINQDQPQKPGDETQPSPPQDSVPSMPTESQPESGTQPDTPDNQPKATDRPLANQDQGQDQAPDRQSDQTTNGQPESPASPDPEIESPTKPLDEQKLLAHQYLDAFKAARDAKSLSVLRGGVADPKNPDDKMTDTFSSLTELFGDNMRKILNGDTKMIADGAAAWQRVLDPKNVGLYSPDQQAEIMTLESQAQALEANGLPDKANQLRAISAYNIETAIIINDPNVLNNLDNTSEQDPAANTKPSERGVENQPGKGLEYGTSRYSALAPRVLDKQALIDGITRYLKQRDPNSPMIDDVKYLVNGSLKWGLNPVYAMAASHLESQACSDTNSVCVNHETHNPINRDCPPGKPHDTYTDGYSGFHHMVCHYDSFKDAWTRDDFTGKRAAGDGTDSLAQYIYRKYLLPGETTAPEILATFTPVSEAGKKNHERLISNYKAEMDLIMKYVGDAVSFAPVNQEPDRKPNSEKPNPDSKFHTNQEIVIPNADKAMKEGKRLVNKTLQTIKNGGSVLNDPACSTGHEGEGCTNLCDHVSAWLYGHAHSGYGSALKHRQQMQAAGKLHNGDDKYSIPVGAYVFWDRDGQGDGHAAIYAGHGQIITTDLYNSKYNFTGGIYLAKADDVARIWGQTYRGWAYDTNLS